MLYSQRKKKHSSQSMKKLYWMAALALALSSLAACGGKSSSGPTTDTTQVPLAVEDGPGRDEARTVKADAQYNGHQYHFDIVSTPDDSLPRVKDRFGDPYLDNRITVSVVRDGGTPVQYSFTKADFSADGTKNQILGGIAFSGADAEGLHFGAQLNAPGDEEGGTAFKITLPLVGSGKPHIVQDTNQDTASDDVMD